VSPLVFCTPEGRSLAVNFKRYWQPVVKAAGLADFRFHDLRHTFASRLVARGVSSYIVQHAGGWRTASMMQRYAHLDPGTIRAAVELLALPNASFSSRSGTDSGTAAPEEAPAQAAIGA
jgi:integrase